MWSEALGGLDHASRASELADVPGRRRTRRGGSTDGAPCKGGRSGLRPEATQGAPRSSRQSGVEAVLPIVTHTPQNPHIAFAGAPPYRDRTHNLPKRQAAARARRAKPGAKGAGKAERSACRAREDYGWGWAGGVTKPNQATNPRPCPQTPAAAQAVRRHPHAQIPAPGAAPSPGATIAR